jgi:hypothetical protein
MSAQWPAPILATGGINPYTGAYVDYTTAQPVSVPAFESPIPATTDEYFFDQEWQQYRANFSPLALNTAHPSTGLTPDYSSFKLVLEGPRRDIGGGVIQWTRRYAVVPASYDDFQSINYSFPGYSGVIAIGSWWNMGSVAATIVSGRPRLNWKVDTRVHYDFFLVGTGGSYTDAGGIPQIFRQLYTLPTALGANDLETDYLMDSLGGGVGPSTPTRTVYDGWITNASTYAWGAGIAPGGVHPGQIIAEDSILTRWMGNIWQRQSFYVLAR